MNESTPKILEGFKKDTFTTDLVDEFMEGDYDYLAIGKRDT